MKATYLFASFLALSTSVYAEQQSKQQYVNSWAETAVEEMFKHGIPASITLAQGILESGSGNSELAVKGNNHFGIKCHGWTGKKMYIDDDAKGECFRVYAKAEESYADHSDFLKRYDRYAFLFTYDTDDYESWAKGLKKAGYATDPNYPTRLISIIEDLGLDQYDGLSKPQIKNEPSLVAQSEIKMNAHSVRSEDKLSYVIVKQGDTFYSISKEFGISMNQLRKYNDFDLKRDLLQVGERIYIKRKKGNDIIKKHEHIVKKDCSLAELAQETGVKASVIKKLNHVDSDRIDFKKGQKIILR